MQYIALPFDHSRERESIIGPCFLLSLSTVAYTREESLSAAAEETKRVRRPSYSFASFHAYILESRPFFRELLSAAAAVQTCRFSLLFFSLYPATGVYMINASIHRTALKEFTGLL